MQKGSPEEDRQPLSVLLPEGKGTGGQEKDELGMLRLAVEAVSRMSPGGGGWAGCEECLPTRPTTLGLQITLPSSQVPLRDQLCVCPGASSQPLSPFHCGWNRATITPAGSTWHRHLAGAQ